MLEAIVWEGLLWLRAGLFFVDGWLLGRGCLMLRFLMLWG